MALNSQSSCFYFLTWDYLLMSRVSTISEEREVFMVDKKNVWSLSYSQIPISGSLFLFLQWYLILTFKARIIDFEVLLFSFLISYFQRGGAALTVTLAYFSCYIFSGEEHLDSKERAAPTEVASEQRSWSLRVGMLSWTEAFLYQLLPGRAVPSYLHRQTDKGEKYFFSSNYFDSFRGERENNRTKTVLFILIWEHMKEEVH